MICDVHWFDQLPFLTQRHCDQCCDLNSDDVRMIFRTPKSHMVHVAIVNVFPLSLPFLFAYCLRKANGMESSTFCFARLSKFIIDDTLDGQNPAPPGMYKTLYIMG